jgi:general secretion pathway protein D
MRSYDISEEAVEKIGLKGITVSTDVTGKFPEVDFPAGASAVYQPKSGKLFIRNTLANLEVAEEIMGAMDVAKLSSDVDQVEIEAKFVEVSEGTLEALGFEWNTATAIPLGDSTSIASGTTLLDNSLRGGTGESLPFVSGAGLLEPSTSPEWSAFRFEDTFSSSPASMKVDRVGSGRSYSALITALDQSSGTDVLSAPRIVARSGEKASIRVGELHYYPEVYEVGANEGNIAHITYQDFSEKLLGVELSVQPQVEGDQISMKLNPKVTELAGWQTFSVINASNSYTYYQYRVSITAKHDPIEARLPVFNRREIDTEITINDGATVGMGGLLSEKVEQYEDKVPVLGSLPLIGRLFRNEGERAVKRNLMIFVTAKKVEASGRINTARSFE